MNDRHTKLEFDPRIEYIDKRDIRNAFGLPRFDDISKMRESNKPFHPDYNNWSLFRSEPMTQQHFTSEDFESDASSVSSGGSTGSSHGQPLRSKMTRGPRIHHIPILVEARDDSSGYSSDARSDENKRPVDNKPKEVITNKQPQATYQSNHVPRTQAPAQRSQSNQEFAPKTRQDMHPKKSASQPPSSPPPAANNVPQPGPFVTQVRLNAPVNVEEKQAQQSQERKPMKPKADPKQQIQDILDEMFKLKQEVEQFTGTTKDKQYRYLDEMLTRLMLKLDDVNTDGQEGIRQERRQAVREIQNCISLLEQRIAENEEKKKQPNTETHPMENGHGNGTPL